MQMQAPSFWPSRMPRRSTGFDDEFAIDDGFVDAREVLVNDAAGAEVEVADFGIAHLAYRQTDIEAARGEAALRIGGVEVIVKGRLREQRRIAIGFRLLATVGIDAPTVADDENDRLFRHGRAGKQTCRARQGRNRRGAIFNAKAQRTQRTQRAIEGGLSQRYGVRRLVAALDGRRSRVGGTRAQRGSKRR